MNPAPPALGGDGSDGDSSHVGAGVNEVLMICHDELRLCAFVTDVPLSSRSRSRMRFSRSRSRTGLLAVDEEGDLEAALLELGDGFWVGRGGLVRLGLEAVGDVPGWGEGERADRHAVVRSEGSSSEKM